jgi:hypothetical protein
MTALDDNALGNKRGFGQPPHEPTDIARRTVKTMTACGLKQTDICAVLDISVPTLEKYYRRELDIGAAEVHTMIGQSLIFNAIGGPDRDWTKANVSAAIFYAKTRMGWKEPQAIEISGPDRGPIQAEFRALDRAAQDRILAQRIAPLLTIIKETGT